MANLSDYNPALKYGANIDVNVNLADIRDQNNNELLEFTGISSAVNYIGISNAATGNAPSASAVGDDTNVDFQLYPKGTASVLIGDRNTGTVASGSITINATRGRITTASLTTGIQGITNFDFVNNRILPTSVLLLNVVREGNTVVGLVPKATIFAGIAGSATIRLENHGTAALSGTADIDFIVL